LVDIGSQSFSARALQVSMYGSMVRMTLFYFIYRIAGYYIQDLSLFVIKSPKQLHQWIRRWMICTLLSGDKGFIL
jgi:hypothetical protein